LQNFSFVEELCHPEDFERVKLEYNTAISIGEDFNIEFRLRGKDQQEKVILAIGGATKNDKGRLGKLRVTLQDITDSKIALLTLQTLESRFKSLFENSLDGVILSKVEGNIISANPSICKMLGYLHEELVNLQRNQLMDLEDDNVKLMIEQRKRNGAYIGEISLKHKNGEEVPAEITTISLKDAKGQEYFSSIIRDITEKKKTENEQKVLTEELLKNNQDLQQFSYITSHNLRAPVANLISLLNLYNKENPADDFNQLLIQKFEEATNQLNETLNDLLNVLVIKSNTNVQKEHVCFMDVLERVQNSVNNLLEETNGQIEADLISPAFVEYNRIHLESIFLNLVSNAIRYRFPGRPPVIKISSYRQDKWTVVTFEDNGLGMDLNRYGDRLFGLYQRFHENKEGKGLGLYMTRSQIIAAGGKIEVESELGKGSTFKIYFKS
jgi:PAS domain S-box-containing protein